MSRNLKSVLLYTCYLYRFEIVGQTQKSIKQFLYMAIVGNRNIWFDTIFPYMVMEGNEGTLFSTIISLYGNGGKWRHTIKCHKNTTDVAVLLELLLYCSSVWFSPVVLFVWEALHVYKASPIINFFLEKKWCSSLYKCTWIIYLSQYCFIIIIYIYTLKVIVF